jgi:anti-sigma regulatory factor (Ser/Thr protein kinase)
LAADGVRIAAGVDDPAHTPEVADGKGPDVAASVCVIKRVQRPQALAEFEEVGGADGIRDPGALPRSHRQAATPIESATMTITAAPVGPQRYQERYPATLEAAGRARRDMALALQTWGLPQLVEVARQIVTELVANAVEHTDASTVGASITRTGTVLSARIVVTDTSRRKPAPGTPSPGDEDGRGLLIVDALAHRWGSELVHGGKRVWAELRADGEQ